MRRTRVLVNSTYDFAHDLVPFHRFMALANILPTNDAIYFALEFAADNPIHGVLQKLFFQSLLVL